MNHLFPRIGLAALLACALLSLGTSPARAQDAAATFKAKCAMCHGADGKGSAMGQKMGVHDFASAEVQKETDAELAEIISGGKGRMPAYKDRLKESEIKDLVAYIRTLGKK
ncbi:MAG TPA: c-type cytochrome [Candidatus Aquilonibacter sp.]|nr:c-type cytochrome [Candidatus Aquilonibacter sp.]